MYLFMLHVTLLIGKLMSQVQEKVFAACAKKKLSLTKALVAMPYVLCLPAFILPCQLLEELLALILLVQLAQLFLASSLPLSLLSRLVFVLIFNGELATSNMMFLTSDAYYGKIKWSKVLPSSSTVPSLILLVSLSWPGSSTNPSLSII